VPMREPATSGVACPRFSQGGASPGLGRFLSSDWTFGRRCDFDGDLWHPLSAQRQLYRCRKTRGYSYGPVIDQSNLHHGLENPIFHLFGGVSSLNFAVEVLIQKLSFIAPQSPMKIRFVSLLGRSEQGEL